MSWIKAGISAINGVGKIPQGTTQGSNPLPLNNKQNLGLLAINKSSPNFTPTKDPNVVIGKHGVPITRAEFENANKNGYAWKDFNAYADYVGGWSKPITQPMSISPYYRQYGNSDKINGGEIAMLAAKEPMVQKILSRTISKNGEVPQFSPEDGDLIKGLINKEKTIALSSYPLSNNMLTINK